MNSRIFGILGVGSGMGLGSGIFAVGCWYGLWVVLVLVLEGLIVFGFGVVFVFVWMGYRIRDTGYGRIALYIYYV